MDIGKYIGHPSQLYGATPYIFSDGKAKGVRAVRVRNGVGLDLEILPDRGMDISALSYKGVNLSYMSKCGIVGPEYFKSSGDGFLDSFNVGFLTTCGLRHIGAPCVVDGEEFGLHGTVSNTPAEEMCSRSDESMISVSGKVRDGRIFKQNLLLERVYLVPVGGEGFAIRSRVHNLGFREEAVMLMLHINFGYPLLDAGARLYLPSASVEPRDEDAKNGLGTYGEIEPPGEPYPEQVLFHTLRSGDDGRTALALVNQKLGFGVAIRFNVGDFPYLTQWKQFGYGDYVLGLEPASCKMIGRKAHSEAGTLTLLPPRSFADFDLEVEILDGVERIESFVEEFSDL